MTLKIPTTLRSRLALFNTLILTGILLFSFISAYFVLRTWLFQEVDNSLDVMGQQVALNVSTNNHSLSSKYKVEITKLEKARQFVRIITPQGQVQEHYGSLQDLPVSGSWHYAQKSRFETISKPNDDELIRVFTLPVRYQGKIIGFVQTGQSLETVVNMLEVTFRTLLILIPLSLLIVLIGSRWITKKTLAPLAEIADTAEQITEQELHRRLAIKGDDEVARLAGSLDRMLDRLEGSFESYRQFIGDVSHELRTPLTVMKGEISLALQRERDEQYYVQVLSCLDDEVDRLGRLIEQLLFLARTEGEKIQLNVSYFNLSETMALLFKKMNQMAQEKGQELVWNISDDVCLETDRDILQQIVLNLLENAVKYTPEGGHIKLEGAQQPQAYTIMISDTGEGIAKENLERIFDRFYQTDRQHNRGSGLGLAIVKKLVSMLGGVLHAESVEGQGTTFLIEIPKHGIES